jgi:hypothetical protein
MARRPKGIVERFAEITERASRLAEVYRREQEEKRHKKASEHSKRVMARYWDKVRRDRERSYLAAKMTRREVELYWSRAQKAALPGWMVVTSRMEPGAWCGNADLVAIADAAGYAGRNSIRALLTRMMREGVIERAPNADHGRDPLEPRWLYRLTETGAQRAKSWREYLEAVE